MMAKYQKKEQTSAERPEDERPLEDLLPPPVLPTLSTLTGKTITESQLPQEPTDENELKETKEKEAEISQMGAGMSTDQENAVLSFLNEVYQEFQLVEWPTLGRIVRLTIICLITIVLATAALYIVDGFFYRAAKFLFSEDF